MKPQPPDRSPLIRATRAAANRAVDGVLFSDQTSRGLRDKFDIQLSQGLIAEQRLALYFRHAIFMTSQEVRIELKSETYQWEATGNLAIEYLCDGKPSGLSTTRADLWVHELRRGGETLLWLMFPMARLKELARQAIYARRCSTEAGDGGRFAVALIRLKDILK